MVGFPGLKRAVVLFVVFSFISAATQRSTALRAAKPESWVESDKVAMTHFFYWYDIHTNSHFIDPDGSDAITHHPPPDYLPDYSYKDLTWHRREVVDAMAARIDVLLPVYWGDRFNAVWSKPGLQKLVAAVQGLISEGYDPPRIGMFFDTTALKVENNGRPPDLTTNAGKQLFYQMIHDFFTLVPSRLRARIDGRVIVVLYTAAWVSKYSQATFDEAADRLEADFGERPYLIREASWEGIAADGAYPWGVAYFGPAIMGRVGSVGPGFDETAVYGIASPPRVRNRAAGNFYRTGWDQMISGGVRQVLIETWNEFHEGTDIAASREYDRTYIDLTARKIEEWKAADFADAATVWVDLGRESHCRGLRPAFNGPDGAWSTVFLAGREGAFPVRSTQPASYYIYLDVSNDFCSGSSTEAWITVEYFDGVVGSWGGLDYDSVDSPYRRIGPVVLEGSGTWKRHSFHVADAFFGGRQNGSADLRLVDFSENQQNYFGRVWISRTGPVEDPPQLNTRVELIMNPGQVLEVPLSVSGKAGAGLDPTLDFGPPFASLRTSKSGRHFLRLSPADGQVQAEPYPAKLLLLEDGNPQRGDAAIPQVTVTSLPQTLWVPQIADGILGTSLLQTSFVFVNTGPDTEAEIRFFDSSGRPMSLTLGSLGTQSGFTIPLPRGAVRAYQTPGNKALKSGYVSIAAGRGVGGTAIYTYSEKGVARYEAGVPFSRGITDFRVFMDNRTPVNTGLAMVNVGSDPSRVQLDFHDVEGGVRSSTEFELAAGEHRAQYLTEILPDVVPLGIRRGLVRVSSTQPVAVVTLHQNGKMLSVFPVCEGAGLPVSVRRSAYFPHLGVGTSGSLRLTSSVFLVGSGATSTLSIEFLDQNGTALPLNFGATGTRSRLEMELKEEHSTVLETVATGPLGVGWARSQVVGDVGGTILFSMSQDGTTLFDAGVPAVEGLTDFSIYMDSSVNLYETGLALANPESRTAEVTLRLYDAQFRLVSTKTLWLPGSGQTAFFAWELFPQINSLRIEQGSITVGSDVPLAAVTLRQRDSPAKSPPDDYYLISVFPVVPGRADW